MDGMRIVDAARGWIGTRFHHQGRVKRCDAHRGGVDCLGLLIGVAGELHLTLDGKPFASFDDTTYSHYPDTEHLKSQLLKVLCPTDNKDLLPGDVVLLNVDSRPQHLAIVSTCHEGLGIIHAYAPARSVVEHHLDDWWLERIVSVFRIKS